MVWVLYLCFLNSGCIIRSYPTVGLCNRMAEALTTNSNLPVKLNVCSEELKSKGD